MNELKDHGSAQRDETIDIEREPQEDGDDLAGELAAIAARLTHLHDELDQHGAMFLHMRPRHGRFDSR